MATKKKTRRKAVPKKRKSKAGNPGYHIRLAKKEYKKKIGNEYAKLLDAKNKTARKKINKRINLLRTQYRKL